MQKWPWTPSCHPIYSFQIPAALLFSTQNWCEITKKTNGPSQINLETNHRWTGWQGQIFKIPLPEIFCTFFLHTLAKFQDSNFTVAWVVSQNVILNKPHFCKKGHFLSKFAQFWSTFMYPRTFLWYYPWSASLW